MVHFGRKVVQHKMGRKSGAGQYWRCGDERRRLSHLTLSTVCGAMLWPYVTFLTLATVKLVSVWPLALLHCHCHLPHSLATVWWVLWCGQVGVV